MEHNVHRKTLISIILTIMNSKLTVNLSQPFRCDE